MSSTTTAATARNKQQAVHRGYSTFAHTSNDGCCVHGASTTHNVLIKKRLPARGVVSSNPKRVKRLLQRAEQAGLLSNIREHTNCGWGVTIYLCTYRRIEIFVAAVPMGAGGSGFAFFEMFAAGAQAIVRYGSNDRQVELENLRELVVVDQADNLVGLSYGSAHTKVSPETIIPASTDLVNLLSETIASKQLPARRMICHHVEDYHAYNFHEFFDNEDRIESQIQSLERDHHGRGDCWDMESAALFYRAQQFGLHSASVLQNLYKKPGTTPYEGEHGKISLEMEDIFYQVIFDTLAKFTPKELVHPEGLASGSPTRAPRLHASNDFVGGEDPLNNLSRLDQRKDCLQSFGRTEESRAFTRFVNLLTLLEVVAVLLVAVGLATLPLVQQHWLEKVSPLPS